MLEIPDLHMIISRDDYNKVEWDYEVTRAK